MMVVVVNATAAATGMQGATSRRARKISDWTEESRAVEGSGRLGEQENECSRIAGSSQ
jgi:hypothetical protein